MSEILSLIFFLNVKKCFNNLWPKFTILNEEESIYNIRLFIHHITSILKNLNSLNANFLS